MKTHHFALILLIALSSAACSGEPSQATPSPAVSPPTATPDASPAASFRHGPQGFVADLHDAGAQAEVTGSFNGEPLAVEGLVVCVNGHDVRVYAFSSEQEREAVAATIDPDNPSNMGTSIVEWDGWAQFWQRDRILVLYQGPDQATIDLLNQLMGAPFASGPQKPQLLPGGC